MRKNEREGGREIIQGHNQKALVRRLRVRREEGDFTDSVVSQEDAATQKEREDKEVQEKDTSLCSDPLGGRDKQTSKPHTSVWFYQGYEVVLCCFYHVFVVRVVMKD